MAKNRRLKAYYWRIHEIGSPTKYAGHFSTPIGRLQANPRTDTALFGCRIKDFKSQIMLEFTHIGTTKK